MINGIAEANFEGEINMTDKDHGDFGDDQASLNRFTIAVNIKYTNSETQLNFEQTFTIPDYDSREFQRLNQNHIDIVKLIVEVFNCIC
jgi:hypothetical protein